MTYTTNGHTPGAEQRIAIDPATGMAVGYAPPEAQSPLNLPPPPSEQAAPPPAPAQSAPPPAPTPEAAPPQPDNAPNPTIGQRLDNFLSRPKRQKPQNVAVQANSTKEVELVGQRVEVIQREVAVEVDATWWGCWINEPAGRVVVGALAGWGLRRWIPWIAGAGMFSVSTGVGIAVALLIHGHKFMRPAIAQRLAVIVLVASVSVQISPPRPNFAIPGWLNNVLYGPSQPR